MRKSSLIIIAFFVVLTCANAQQIDYQHIDLDLQKLTDLKWDYERYRNITQKRDSVFVLYKNQINKIKKKPDIYLSYIKLALKKNRTMLTKETVYYKYVSGTGEYINKSWHKIKKIDLYRVVRYSLFKRDDEILPEDFRGLPIIDEKDYNGYDKTKQGDFKIASRFLLYNLSLTSQEIKFIKNDNNQLHVLDMKKYLDKYGLSTENKEFIKWAINYLIKYPKFSLAYLDNAYDAIRYRDIVPRDKEPNNSN